MKIVTRDINIPYLERYLETYEVKNFIEEMTKLGVEEIRFYVDRETNEHWFECDYNGHHSLWPFFRIELPF